MATKRTISHFLFLWLPAFGFISRAATSRPPSSLSAVLSLLVFSKEIADRSPQVLPSLESQQVSPRRNSLQIISLIYKRHKFPPQRSIAYLNLVSIATPKEHISLHPAGPGKIPTRPCGPDPRSASLTTP